ncbi:MULTISPECIES: TetM/TetW/TetO/TetS family tetracycline resistance ribosomal protection protein [Coprococcus]|jgi:ribosomal protection tetracycline resistance protein|uniref:translation factor GTPase family protein n=4 Tax=Lachnospiraceae TaxID=186803 RepID=UPI0006C5096E|nr:TetM/TetW/TetO/TetS family tetracycline resistance ribosomal protection protein [Coprococcus eutactus]MEE0076543.1 translation factor GTPase family protein [Coprococcus sp.]NSE73229.1 GTP-binding protein [Coprococcus eutactus]CUO12463.1 Elongation factor G [Coprococcus eutactus]
MKNIVAGILAHVDSGKTTLSEAMLYQAGQIRKLGRVDHQDTYLDTDSQEKDRGITIFSKQAELAYADMHIALLDTPGHVDFGTEMERTLQVLDYVVLVINGMDGVQSHTETLWKLLERYGIPVFIFVNKMDMTGYDRDYLMDNIRHRLSDGCVDFLCEDSGEQIAMCDEAMLEHFLETGANDEQDVVNAIAGRKLFPCYFGSALKNEGVSELLDGMNRYVVEPVRGEEFGARVFKIGRDDKGERLTYMKVTGGVLKLKDVLTLRNSQGEESHEKVNQIRVYSGAKYDMVTQVPAGCVCAVPGLVNTYGRQGIGACLDGELPSLEPVLSYKVMYPTDVDAVTMVSKLRLLEEEDPQLQVQWNETAGEIYIKVMGQVQLEVVAQMVRDRFGIAITYGQGRISYKETIAAPVMGVGHFEPLRHYAEVHLLLEPMENGSGMCFDSICSEDVLDKNWQRLILTHLQEREFRGVLTGSPITDMKISITAGRAHQKHTEGGDFRQATYRAVRQGLMMAESVLLEPVYAFKIEVPQEYAGRVLADIVKMSGTMDGQEISGETTVITGHAPVYTMREYYSELTAFSRGTGRLQVDIDGYQPCHNTEEVLAERHYDPELDRFNPSSSVFCAHGAGYLVDWYDVYENMHVKEDPGFEISGQLGYTEDGYAMDIPVNRPGKSVSEMSITDEELSEIFARTFGGDYKDKDVALNGRFRRTTSEYKVNGQYNKSQSRDRQPGNGPLVGSRPADRGIATPGAFKRRKSGEDYVIVDGYNVIFAWDTLRELSEHNIDSARGKLMDILSNYQGYMNCHLIVVFDGYKVKDNKGERFPYDDIEVVYTKEGETADAHIEKLTHEIARKHKVTVVTSDGLEQIVTMGQGAIRMSSRDFKAEVERVNEHLRENYLKND